MHISYPYTTIFGPLPFYYDGLIKGQVITEDNENFQKKSFRNRYFINSSQGLLCLSIPLVKGKNNQTPIKEVKISYDERWITKHIHTWQTCYGKSPYIIYYQDAFIRILEKKYTYLFDLNLAIAEKIWQYLKADIMPQCGSQQHHNKTTWQPYTPPHITHIDYPTLWDLTTIDVNALSILDLLFNSGPESKALLLDAIVQP